MIGRNVGRFRITAPLGEGGMGTVWRGEDTLLGRAVALKLLSASRVASEPARQRFLREARAASRLEHPAIATVYDAGEADGLAYIAYQLVEGETVAQRVARGALSLAEAVAIAAGVAEALAHAHERGVLHRDVTAGNVMVTGAGRAVLVDFGLALPDRHAQLTTTGTTLGTPAYLAPELIRGEPADQRSDLYGLGVVLYQMVSGRVPFEGDTAEAALYRVVNEAPEPPSRWRAGLLPELERLVLALLAKEPAARPQKAAEVVETLRALEASGALTRPARAPSWWVRSWRALATWGRTARRELRQAARTRVGVVSLAITLAVVALVALAWQRGWIPGLTSSIRTVAVLPLRNQSADVEETAYLAEGCAEALATRLAGIEGLRVLPWETTQRFADRSRPLPDIARELGVDALVLGTFRASAERARVTLSLVEGKRGFQRWGQDYEEPLADVLTLQKNLALGVASHLKRGVTALERRALASAPSQSVEAYDHYLRGASYFRVSDPETKALAQPFFEKAIELDPKLAEAHVGLGATCTERYFEGDVGGIENLTRAEDHFRRALELRPDLGTARRGLIKVYSERGECEECLRVAQGMIAHGPDDVEALLVRAEAYMGGGLPEKATPLFDRVVELDPANQGAAWYRVIATTWSGQMSLALERGRAYIRKFGEDPEIYGWMGSAAYCVGAKQDTRLYYERAMELYGNLAGMHVVEDVVRLAREMGDSTQAKELLAQWIPLLERQREASPDNMRVRGALIGLYDAAGRRSDAAREAREVRELILRSGLQGASGAERVLLAFADDESSAREATALLRTRDLAAWWPFASPACIWATHSLPPTRTTEAQAQFVRDVEARLAYLRQKY